MKVYTNIPKTTYVETTKNNIVARIKNAFRMACYGSSTILGSGIIVSNNSSRPDVIRVYNLEKRRAKKEISPKKTFKGQKGDIAQTKIVERGHWIAQTYDFNSDVLKAAGITVHQGTRTFKIKDSKGNKMSIAEYNRQYG